MAPAYKLMYFPIKGLTEPIRFLFKYGNIEFEDFRFQEEDWPKLKPNTPFGQVPTLEVEGKKVVHQSVPICRYLAKQLKLVGKDDWEDLEIDAMVATINDLRQSLGSYHYENNEAAKEQKKGPLFKETIPFYLERLDNIAKANNGYLCCGRLTWADLYFIGMLDYLNFMAKFDLTSNHPNLASVKKNVLGLPQIKEWVATRPDTVN